MKHKISLVFSVVLILSVLAGCQQSNNNSDIAATSDITDDSTDNSTDNSMDDKLSVVATIFPQYDFIREIAGDKVELTMLLSPGSESHSFDPTPQDIITIENCDIFIYVGGESDEWVNQILDSMDTSSMKIISLMNLVDLVEEEIIEGMEEEEEGTEEGAEKGAEEEIEYDEHIWTSPKNAMTIVQYISDTLCELDKNNASVYTASAASYLEKLNELDESFQTVVDNAETHTLVFADRFPFRYFADTYGLDYYAAFPGCSTETEASAATVAFLIDKVNEENIPVVFYLEFSNEKMADTICESTNAKKLLLHSCHNISKDEFESGISYLDLMTQNVENLKEALQ